MGRRRIKHRELPPCVYFRDGGYYHVVAGKWTHLGRDKAAALRLWAEREGASTPYVATTLEAAWMRYANIVLPKKKPRTQKDNRLEAARLMRVFGKMSLDKIRPADVRQYMDRRADSTGKSAPIRATREKALLSHIFNNAREWGMTSAPNPCAGIRGAKSQRDRYITHAELKKIREKATAELRDAIDLAELIGQRHADVTSIIWDDIQDGVLRFGQGKTGTKMEIVVSDALQSVLDRCKARSLALGSKSPYVIVNSAGLKYNEWTLRAHWRQACKAAGVENARFMDLRAKAASDVEDPQHAQKLLGHKHASTTQVYIRGRRGSPVKPVR